VLRSGVQPPVTHSSRGIRAQRSLAAVPPRRKATSPPSAQLKKPHVLVGQWKYCRPLLGVSFCTTADSVSRPHRHFGGVPEFGGGGGGGGASAGACESSLPLIETCEAGNTSSTHCLLSCMASSTSARHARASSSGRLPSSPCSSAPRSGACSAWRLDGFMCAKRRSPRSQPVRPWAVGRRCLPCVLTRSLRLTA
jgi:hypothetical protein